MQRSWLKGSGMTLGLRVKSGRARGGGSARGVCFGFVSVFLNLFEGVGYPLNDVELVDWMHELGLV